MAVHPSLLTVSVKICWLNRFVKHTHPSKTHNHLICSPTYIHTYSIHSPHLSSSNNQYQRTIFNQFDVSIAIYCFAFPIQRLYERIVFRTCVVVLYSIEVKTNMWARGAGSASNQFTCTLEDVFASVAQITIRDPLASQTQSAPCAGQTPIFRFKDQNTLDINQHRFYTLNFCLLSTIWLENFK